MAGRSDQPATDSFVPDSAAVETAADLAGLLRALRRRHARDNRDSELTYRELAARTGWSPSAIAEYFTARTLPPTDRFDALIGLLGATSAEQGALATARDRVEERRRTGKTPRAPTPQGTATATAPAPAPAPATVPPPRQLPAVTRRFIGR